MQLHIPNHVSCEKFSAYREEVADVKMILISEECAWVCRVCVCLLVRVSVPFHTHTHTIHTEVILYSCYYCRANTSWLCECISGSTLPHKWSAITPLSLALRFRSRGGWTERPGGGDPKRTPPNRSLPEPQQPPHTRSPPPVGVALHSSPSNTQLSNKF